jgi:hypothetical protein
MAYQDAVKHTVDAVHSFADKCRTLRNGTAMYMNFDGV